MWPLMKNAVVNRLCRCTVATGSFRRLIIEQCEYGDRLLPNHFSFECTRFSLVKRLSFRVARKKRPEIWR